MGYQPMSFCESWAGSPCHFVKRTLRFLLLRLHKGKEDYVANTLGSGQHHHEAIDAQAHSAGWGHAVAERGEEVFVHLLLLFLVADLVRKIRRLDVWVVQFGVAG